MTSNEIIQQTELKIRFETKPYSVKPCDFPEILKLLKQLLGREGVQIASYSPSNYQRCIESFEDSLIVSMNRQLSRLFSLHQYCYCIYFSSQGVPVFPLCTLAYPFESFN